MMLHGKQTSAPGGAEVGRLPHGEDRVQARHLVYFRGGEIVVVSRETGISPIGPPTSNNPLSILNP